MPRPLVERADDLDTRRELCVLLDKIRPRARVMFLQWCCRQVTRKGANPKANVWRMHQRIEAAERGDQRQDEALTRECYLDLWALSLQYGLDIHGAGVELERRVKGR